MLLKESICTKYVTLIINFLKGESSMKKAIFILLACILLIGSSMSAFAATPKEESDFRITDETTLGDVMLNTDPETYYRYSDKERSEFDSINFKELVENGEENIEGTNTKSRTWTPTFAAGLSTQVSSPSSRALSYSGTIQATQACPSLYLSAIAYDNNGNVVSSMANTRYGSTTVTVANVRYNLPFAASYHVSFYGIIQAPLGLTPETGVVTSTKYVQVN